MELIIGDKAYNLYFGLDAIATLDKMYNLDIPELGVKNYGNGVQMVTLRLIDKDPVALANIIKAGTSTLNSKPSNASIEEYIGNVYEKGMENQVIEEVLEELKKQPLTKRKVSAITNTIYQELEMGAPKI